MVKFLRLKFNMVIIVVFLVIRRFIGQDCHFIEIDGRRIELWVMAGYDSGPEGGRCLGNVDEWLYEIISFVIE